ncbi:hypothetical protein [Corynebacterium sp.]
MRDPVFVVGKEVRLRTLVLLALLGIVGFVALLVGGWFGFNLLISLLISG